MVLFGKKMPPVLGLKISYVLPFSRKRFFVVVATPFETETAI